MLVNLTPQNNLNKNSTKAKQIKHLLSAIYCYNGLIIILKDAKFIQITYYLWETQKFVSYFGQLFEKQYMLEIINFKVTNYDKNEADTNRFIYYCVNSL
jgi:hypothetical protein